MNFIVFRASDCNREVFERDARAHKQLKFGFSDVENLVKYLEALPPNAQARFMLERTPFPMRPLLPVRSRRDLRPILQSPPPSPLRY